MSIQAVGREIERAQRQAVASAASLYQTNFWYSWRQRLGYRLIELIPSVRRRMAAKNVVFLKCVRVYKPQILEQYKRFEKNFRRWEEENAGPERMGSEEALRLEREAKAEIIRLTEELQQKLQTNGGWMYRPLAKFQELVFAWEGYLRTDAVEIYWTEVENFLKKRSREY